MAWKNLQIGGDVVIVRDERLLTVNEILAQSTADIGSATAVALRPAEDEILLRQAKALKAARGNKIERDGVHYDSRDEMRRHDILLEWQRAGIISSLEHHPVVRILDGFNHPSVGHVRARNWEFDFAYQQVQAPGLYVWEDYKGRRMPEWKAALPYRLWALRDRHVFVNDSLSGWYTPV